MGDERTIFGGGRRFYSATTALLALHAMGSAAAAAAAATGFSYDVPVHNNGTGLIGILRVAAMMLMLPLLMKHRSIAYEWCSSTSSFVIR